MVTCTTPPFRAAVRLNSGVSHHEEGSCELRFFLSLPLPLLLDAWHISPLQRQLSLTASNRTSPRMERLLVHQQSKQLQAKRHQSLLMGPPHSLCSLRPHQKLKIAFDLLQTSLPTVDTSRQPWSFKRANKPPFPMTQSAGQSQPRGVMANNSFKPRPLRGSAAW